MALAVTVSVGALTALLAAPSGEPATARARVVEVSQTEAVPQRADQIEAMLAGAGCPGWMVLAEEGDEALGPPTHEDLVRQASVEAEVRMALKARAVASSTDDPDDLLGGEEDLLLAPAGLPDELDGPALVAEPEAEIETPPVAVEESPSLVDDDLLLDDDLLMEEAPGPERPPAQSETERLLELLRDRSDLLEGTPPTSPAVAPSEAPIGVLPAPPAVTPMAPHSLPSQAAAAPPTKPGEKKTYCEFLADELYPSAETCRTCHEKIYGEWRVSSHAYAFISPMFHKFEQTISEISRGTVGYFCYRCHSPVGTSLGIDRTAPMWDIPPVAREGVTCIACHRVNHRYGKVNGERRIEPGNLYAPVYGSIGGGGVAQVIANADHYKVKTSPHQKGPGQPIHIWGKYFDQLSKPEFCVSCHQVAVQPGIKLEVVWEQYRASPACKKGVSCQDCHMGRIPGVPSGYEVGAAAVVAKKTVSQHRKHANHLFYGPGYSIAHPGVFPFNPDAKRWSIDQWLQFDYRAGWGTDAFEDALARGEFVAHFPPVWANVDDRYDAREILDDNQKVLDAKDLTRQRVLENGSHVDGPYFDTPLVRGRDLRLHYVVTNTNEGHNLPTGSLGAQPQLWANVVLIGPRGNRLWESGYTDRWGDVADIHSIGVRHKQVPFDTQLFNLQTMFLITSVKGADREFPLPVNVSFDPLPFLRPGVQPISTMNHPPFIRMEGRSLAPLGSRRVPYKIPAHLLTEPGCYRLSFRMRSRAEPIYFMRFCNATMEMQRAMNEGICDFHQSSVTFRIE
ncbi:MAG: multiheme c-type cytochrome [Planctomycetota bacterium]